jgi:ribosome-associated protein
MASIQVTDTISIDENEIAYDFVQASGPGGQNVNKVATAVQLRYNVRQSPSLPPGVRERLEQLAGNRLTQDGVLILEAQRFRSQERNRRDALARLIELVCQAAQKPKRRRKTRPTAASRRRRLESKRRRSQTKKWRRRVRRDEE